MNGRRVRITSVDLDGEAAAWLGAVGLHEGEELVVLRRAALGGPLHVRTGGGGEFAVAREVAQRIIVRRRREPAKASEGARRERRAVVPRSTASAPAAERVVRRATLAARSPSRSPGRPNSGKSSLYNALTGGDAHVGNYPGITVDILEGDVKLPSGAHAVVVDLPGFYSVEATVDKTTDEGVARAFLDAFEKSGERLVVVQVIDPTRLALGLRLTAELLRAHLPLVVVLTHRTCSAARATPSTSPRSPAPSARRSSSSTRATRDEGRVLAAIDDRAREGIDDARRRSTSTLPRWRARS